MATQEYIPIRPRSGGLVHATQMKSPGKTACGIKCNGWIVEPKRLSCPECRALIHLPVRNTKERAGRVRP